MSEYLDITFLGNTELNTPLDYIILDQHGDDGALLLDQFPEILNNVSDGEKLKEYLNLEKDIGAPELVDCVGNIMGESVPEKKGAIVHVKLPRGIVDLNRITKIAVRNLFTEEQVDIIKVLQNIHRTTLNAIKNILKNLSRNGVFLDVHTMCPYNPPSGIIESPNSLVPYIDAYKDSQNYKKRIICIISANEDQKVITDVQFTKEISENLEQENLPYAYNEPYYLAEGIIGQDYALSANGLFIDFPKDYLTKEKHTDPVFDLSNLTIDAQKIKNIAKNVIAKAFIKRLEG